VRASEEGHTAILSLGPIGVEAEKAIALSGRDVALYDMVFCKPLDTTLLQEVFARFQRVITVEDGSVAGGFGSAILEEANRQGYHGEIIPLGLPDKFVEQGTCSELYSLCGIDAESISKCIKG
jgi:1-deoxy-D-xylulose-5-phosphate synthase